MSKRFFFRQGGFENNYVECFWRAPYESRTQYESARLIKKWEKFPKKQKARYGARCNGRRSQADSYKFLDDLT